MLPVTLALQSGTYTRKSDNNGVTVYTYDSTYPQHPYIINVRHSEPPLGKPGVVRHNVSISGPVLKDQYDPAADETQTVPDGNARVTVNFTITHDNLAGGRGTNELLLDMIKFLSNGTAVNADVMGPFTKGHY